MTEGIGARRESPAVSVVIAAYNAAETIDDALRSVMAQTARDFEIIVVDDGSQDDTVDRVMRWAGDDRLRVHRQENSGPARGAQRRHSPQPGGDLAQTCSRPATTSGCLAT